MSDTKTKHTENYNSFGYCEDSNTSINETSTSYNYVKSLTAVEIFETTYPDLSKEFKNIQQEMYETFARKHLDYGLNNIALGGDILNNPKDKNFSLTGLCIRLTDKISRLKNLLTNGKNFVEGEGIQDTFLDIANYGIIGLIVGRDKWKK